MRVSLALLLIGLGLATAAAAATHDEQQARDMMHRYARCVVRDHHARASAAILSDANNATIQNHYADLIDRECLGLVGGNVQMTFGGDLYRYALADALVNMDFVASGPTDFSDRLPLAHLLPPDSARLDAELATIKSKKRQDEAKAEFDRRRAVSWLSPYGECVVRRDPASARLWLLTPPGGPEETSRIRAMQGAFNTCLADGTLQFNRVTMRGAVAINYYRLAMASRVATGGKAH